MNANDFFEQYSIEIINKRTRISPISLRFIKNKEFEKIPRVKFLGFVRIIEKEFHIDLSELIEEYNEATDFMKENSDSVKLKEPKKHNTFILFLLAIIMFSLGAYLLYSKYNTSPSQKELNQSNIKQQFQTTDINTSTDSNTETSNISDTNQTKNISLPNKNIQKSDNANSNRQNSTLKPKSVIIIPNEQVWFQAINIDNNKTVEFLTSNTKVLKGANWYIKFGHGNVTIDYGDKTLTPGTKKIIRLLFKNGQITYMKKPNEYEK